MSLEALIAAIVALTFHLPMDKARIHVEAAQRAAAEYKLPAELLLGIALVESRFDERALSRLECDGDDCKRKTGVWPRATRPPKARPSWFCGPMQTGGNVSWAECQKMRTDVDYGYRVGAKELTIWMDDKTCRGLPDGDRLRCALAGYNGGYAGAANYKRLKYVSWVLLMRDRIVKFAEFAERKAQKPQT